MLSVIPAASRNQMPAAAHKTPPTNTPRQRFTQLFIQQPSGSSGVASPETAPPLNRFPQFLMKMGLA
jgi:hypothetical protein